MFGVERVFADDVHVVSRSPESTAHSSRRTRRRPGSSRPYSLSRYLLFVLVTVARVFVDDAHDASYRVALSAQ